MTGGRFDPERPVDPRDYTRRTLLANERTYLAWWRTGVTALAAALGAARVVPELAKVKHDWPYTVVGVGFAVMGLVCFVYGHIRRAAVDEAVRRGDYADLSQAVTLAISVGAAVLAAALVVLIILAG